jgi:1-aminocyclopropane-1-carboxylate deaminase/D-cysteine desulfhydrase-like pyridoxal-dependent ACC family enzyme
MRLAHGARRLLALQGVALPAPHPLTVADAVGRGYGWPTAAGDRAQRLAAGQGLILDPTYGAKAFGFLFQGRTRDVQRVVFWHTFAVPASTPEPVS